MTTERHMLVTPGECREPGCKRKPTSIAIAISWDDKRMELCATCEEHAAATMGRLHEARAAAEGLQ